MTIYSLYIFDRHCDCVYYQDWHRTRPTRAPPPGNYKPGVHRIPNTTVHPEQNAVRESIFSKYNSNPQGQGQVERDNQNQNQNNRSSLISNTSNERERGPNRTTNTSLPKGLPFDEESKLVYGVILSLRNMVKKLSGRDEAFTSYSTSSYKLHLFDTPTNYRFVLLSDPSSDSLRFILRQLYVGPFLEYVVRNPLVKVDSRTEGIDNDQFRTAVDKHMKGLSMFN
ncbi:uncharacterized protein I303_102721 [Kwoniella dejecticola CBS 10117]|uniref:Trafficking protein particle complex subunit n=1 Tax=Kwoniella dejecticola CBS 10117 TaxID=1296121 RepID=A0A1A6A9J4_9TREE|nr:uncharacterized protein I303_02736 [Kwoniella dejecticola CBS 10117]OBR86723.1 hypothetical protein I303_02736 [Kwoniella dejecticola CBS 10117]